MNICEREESSFIQSIATSPAGICSRVNSYGWFSIIEQMTMLIVCVRKAARLVVNSDSRYEAMATNRVPNRVEDTTMRRSINEE